jgi:hypothetical protein
VTGCAWLRFTNGCHESLISLNHEQKFSRAAWNPFLVPKMLMYTTVPGSLWSLLFQLFLSFLVFYPSNEPIILEGNMSESLFIENRRSEGTQSGFGKLHSLSRLP